jgi:hypothetical protein
MTYLIVPIFASIIAVLLYNGLQYRKYFNALCKEIQKNYSNILNKEIESQISRMIKIHEKCIKNPEHKEWTGFGKTISLWIIFQETNTINKDFYRYLPNNQLKNFIARGYYHYIEDVTTPLTYFYLSCEMFSIFTQDLERQILMNQERFFGLKFPSITDEIRVKNLNEIISLIRNNLNPSQKTITDYYNQLKPEFREIRLIEIHRWLLKS